jgi:uncharacterized protein YaaW (UPF0174 family)
MLSLDHILQELAHIQDKGKELLFLRDVRKNYQALPEADKKAFDNLLYERAQTLHAEVNMLCSLT